jgi:hypothetical protein
VSYGKLFVGHIVPYGDKIRTISNFAGRQRTAPALPNGYLNDSITQTLSFSHLIQSFE